MAANLWSLWLAARIVRRWSGRLRGLAALLPFIGALAWVDSAWGWLFWWW